MDEKYYTCPDCKESMTSHEYQTFGKCTRCHVEKLVPVDEDKPLEAQEIIERLCKLQKEVWSVVCDGSPADCFCGKDGFWGSNSYDGTYKNGYRNYGEALRFIEKTVRAALQQTQAPDCFCISESEANNCESNCSGRAAKPIITDEQIETEAIKAYGDSDTWLSVRLGFIAGMKVLRTKLENK